MIYNFIKIFKKNIFIKHFSTCKIDFWKTTSLYKDIQKEQFINHTWQNNNSITNKNYKLELEKNNVNKEIIDDITESLKTNKMSMRITPYIISLIDWNNFYNDPLAKQFIPTKSLSVKLNNDTKLDSLCEKNDSKVDGIVHRYPNKILFLANNICPVYCKFCTRSYAVGDDTDSVLKDKSIKMNKTRWEKCLDYIRNNQQIEDVLISGGDAFMIPFSQLEYLGKQIIDINNIN